VLPTAAAAAFVPFWWLLMPVTSSNSVLCWLSSVNSLALQHARAEQLLV
jgi:hypothetical protein